MYSAVGLLLLVGPSMPSVSLQFVDAYIIASKSNCDDCCC